MIDFKTTLKPLDQSAGSALSRGEQYTEDLTRKINQITDKSINSFTNSSISINRGGLYSPYAGMVNGYVYSTANYFAFGLPSISHLKLNSVSKLNLSITSTFNVPNGNLDISTLPTSSFEVPTYFVLGQLNWRSTGLFFIPFISTQVDSLMWINDAPVGFDWTTRLELDLSDTIPSRSQDITTGYYDFTSNNNKLTQAQYDLLVGNEIKSLAFTFITNNTGLAGNNATFYNNNFNLINHDSTLTFTFFGNVANF